MKNSLTFLLLLFTLHCTSRGQSADSIRPPIIRPGSIEIGVAGSLVAVEGLSRVALMLRGGTFQPVGRVMMTGEGELGFGFLNGLGALDLQASIGMTNVINGSAVWPYLALCGGIRQEWLGSFTQVRFPVGGDIGLRVMVSRAAALRLSYRYRVVLDDPVASFSEHQIVLGASLLLGNDAPEGAGTRRK